LWPEIFNLSFELYESSVSERQMRFEHLDHPQRDDCCSSTAA
jgi:hypothetical protein